MEEKLTNPVRDFQLLVLGGRFEDSATGEKVCLKFLATDVINEECLNAIRELADDEESAIVVLYSNRDPEQEILAFEAGADDCIPLSFDFRYLSGRLRATVSRIIRTKRPAHPVPPGFPIFINADPFTHEVQVGDQRYRLSPLQFRLLLELRKERGKVVTHQQLERALWGQTGPFQHQSLKQLIRRLRFHLGNYAEAIISMPGIGYMLR